MKVRSPYFAPQGWYPASEGECRSAVQSYLDAGGAAAATQAGLVPHAGWRFSGRTAGLTFAALSEARPQLVFIFGGHMRSGERPLCMVEGAWGTPLGPLPVHTAIAGALAEHFDAEVETTERFNPDNTIELQLPFVKALWPDAEVVAVQVAPGAAAEQLGAWAAEAAAEAGLDALAIGSTDLTHYGMNYGFMPKGSGADAHRWSMEENDRPFLDRVLALDGAGSMQHALANHSACCPGAAGAMLAFARARGASAGQLLEHTSSHEVAGRGAPDMWVGYASVVF